MKKSLALLLALVMLLGILAGCAASSTTEPADSSAETTAPAETAQTEEPAAESTETEEPAAKTIETLKVAFVPSREPQEIITATEPLKELLKTELAKEGYDVGEVEITAPSSASGLCGNGCCARYGTPSIPVPDRLSSSTKKAPASPTGPASPAATTTPMRSRVAGSYKAGVTNTAMDVMLATKMTGVLIKPVKIRKLLRGKLAG